MLILDLNYGAGQVQKLKLQGLILLGTTYIIPTEAFRNLTGGDKLSLLRK